MPSVKSRCPPFLSLCILFSACAPSLCFADWSPMIAGTDFDGLRTDVMTMAGGVISIALIVVGLAYLVRTLSK